MDFPFSDLLNSEWHDYLGSGKTTDKLDNPEFIKKFFNTWGFDLDLPDERQTAELKKLRSIIQNILDRIIQKKAPLKKDLDELKAVLAGADMKYAFLYEEGVYELQVVPVKKDWKWVLHSIALSFAEIMSSDNIIRVKKCNNESCSWVFYDESKNVTRRWCCDTCGNLIKVRECRKRKKQNTGGRETGHTHEHVGN